MTTKKDYVLVVVDMQPKFEAANCEDTIGQVVELCRKARNENQPVIILEYLGNYGPTLKPIMAMFDGYDKVTVQMKNRDDGSNEVGLGLIALGYEGGFSDMNYRVCGVNWSFCVKSTISGLLGNGVAAENITVHEQACNQQKWADWDGTRRFYRTQRVKVSSRKLVVNPCQQTT